MQKVNLSKNRPNQTVILAGTHIHYGVWVQGIRDIPGGVVACYSIGKVKIPVRQQDWDLHTWKEIPAVVQTSVVEETA